MRNLTYCIVCACLLLSACGGRQQKKQDAPRKLTFEKPVPPAMITSDEEIVAYVLKHYWDAFDFADTAYVDKPDVTEQAFVDYLALLAYSPEEKGVASVSSLMDKARADSSMYAYFAGLAERYLDDPNSPYRNEELYIPVLENIIAWDGADELHKLRPQSQLRMAMKNRPGNPAADFTFTLRDGKKMRLYDIRAEYTLLYINNPDCPACRQITAGLNGSELVRMLLDAGKLKIAAVYPDEDLDAWRRHYDDIPATWLNGYDEDFEIRNDDVYSLRAIPTLYLLDRDKKVIVKDASEAQHIEYALAMQEGMI